MIPNDEKLIAQLTLRRKLYDSKGREKLESKADMASARSRESGQGRRVDWQYNAGHRERSVCDES